MNKPTKLQAIAALANAAMCVIDTQNAGNPAEEHAALVLLYEALAAYEATPDEPVLEEALNAADKLALEVEDQLKLLQSGTGVSILALCWKLNAYDKLRKQHARTEPAKATPDEKPGADWMLDAAKEFQIYTPLRECTTEKLVEIIAKHAPAQPVAVSANAVTLADVKKNIARSREELPVLTKMWNSALRVISAAEANLKVERAAKAQPCS